MVDERLPTSFCWTDDLFVRRAQEKRAGVSAWGQGPRAGERRHAPVLELLADICEHGGRQVAPEHLVDEEARSLLVHLAAQRLQEHGLDQEVLQRADVGDVERRQERLVRQGLRRGTQGWEAPSVV